MFCDLNQAIISGEIPELAIVAVGGIPIQKIDNSFSLINSSIDKEILKEYLIKGLGLGAVLTYKNPNKKTLLELGSKCLELGHLWTFNILTLTVLFYNAPLTVRNAFAFDGRFHLSWVEGQIGTKETIFTATANLKQWKKVIERANDYSFNQKQRDWFQKTSFLLKEVLPEYFNC